MAQLRDQHAVEAVAQALPDHLLSFDARLGSFAKRKMDLFMFREQLMRPLRIRLFTSQANLHKALESRDLILHSVSIDWTWALLICVINRLFFKLDGLVVSVLDRYE